MKEAGNDMAFGQVQNSAAIEQDKKLEEELFAFMRKCEGALDKLNDDETGRDVQDVAQKMKELDEREQRLQNYEEEMKEEMNVRMRQLDAMQRQLNAMLNQAKAHETVESPEEEVPPGSPVITSLNVPVDVPVEEIPEEAATRRSSRTSQA